VSTEEQLRVQVPMNTTLRRGLVFQAFRRNSWKANPATLCQIKKKNPESSSLLFLTLPTFPVVISNLKMVSAERTSYVYTFTIVSTRIIVCLCSKTVPLPDGSSISSIGCVMMEREYRISRRETCNGATFKSRRG